MDEINTMERQGSYKGMSINRLRWAVGDRVINRKDGRRATVFHIDSGVTLSIVGGGVLAATQRTLESSGWERESLSREITEYPK